MLPIRDHEPSERFPYVTVAIIAANVVAFAIELLSPDLDAFIGQWALVPSRLDASDPFTWWPVFTAMFLHGGFLHIASNLWFLWIFGDNVEGRFGHARFFGFYLAAGVVAALVQLPALAGSNIPMLGASGAIAGVLGAYLVWFPRHRVDALIPGFFGFWERMTLPATVVLGFWFVTQLFNGTASVVAGAASMGGVAWWAHAGGFAFGWLVARLRQRPRVRVVA